MNRTLISPTLVLLAVLLLVGFGWQQSREALVPDATALLADQAMPRQINENVVLLPTITPSPHTSLLPTPTPLAPPALSWPEPERHPMATPNYYDTEHLARQGITYTMRTSAGFGDYVFNDISPCASRSKTRGTVVKKLRSIY